MPTLDRLGLRHYRARVEPIADLDADVGAGRIGRVRRVDRGEVDVVTLTGEIRALSDSTRAQGDVAPAAGDWVRIGEQPGLGVVIDEVLPRATAIVRRDPAEKELEQVLVANVDVVGAVAGVDRPASIARIERFLVLAEDCGAEPLVVLTKIDLGVSDEWRAVVDQLADVAVIETSARTGVGVDGVAERVRDDRTIVLLGESGSGKSTLVNALVGAEVQQTSEVRSGDAKGRHTTTARELVLVPGGGILIDTPGIRGVGLWDAEPAVDRVFSDITERADDCRFRDCSHRVEPGCAVMAAVERGDLDGHRVERYLRLRAELDEQAERLEEQRRRGAGHPRR